MITSEFENDEQQETEDDLAFDATPRFDASLTATDWTIGTILAQIRRGTIDLNPKFQRRDAWRIKRKSEFIEYIVVNIPVPQIVLAERKRGSFIVIDGKQRLLTLKQFAGLDPENASYNAFKLQGLNMRKDLNRITYKDLEDDPDLSDELNAFENFTLRSVVIRNWPTEDFLYLVFYRLNTASVQLSPQEIRQALHPGRFSEFVDTYSIESSLIRRVLGSKKPDFRMRDAELVIRFFAFSNFLGSYKGNLKPMLDMTTEHFNSRWAELEETVQAQRGQLEASIEATFSIFGEQAAFRKWDGAAYESALNRAVFDVMTLFFADAEIAKVAVEEKGGVVTAFQQLCMINPTFRGAIEGTTKSKSAIAARLTLWAHALQSVGVPGSRLEARLLDLSLQP